MFDIPSILKLHEETVRRWHEEEVDNPYEGFLELVCRQHAFNFRLWHEEDIARSPDASDAEIAGVKRRIDQLNQQRNDHIELMDLAILDELQRYGIQPDPIAPLNTETPGSAIDRLSILALRIFHMEEQAARAEVEESHRRRAVDRLEILRVQKRDLSEALGQLWDDIRLGKKRLKVYRQMKMYNDPSLNPYLYGKSREKAKR